MATTTATNSQSVATGRSKTSIHVTALDGIVNVNSLFTLAVFIGLSLTTPSSSVTGHKKPSCTASVNILQQVIVFEVISFSFFLFSSLIAQSLKLAINLGSRATASTLGPHAANIDSFCVKYGMLGSATGSILGCTFLMLSIVDFVQVKLGTLGCGGKSAFAIVSLVILVGSSLLVYVLTVVYASFFM